MKKYIQPVRLAIFAIVALVISASFIEPSSASIGTITKADLNGNWQMAIVGVTGCGNHSMVVTVTLANGVGTNAVIKSHAGCGDSTTSGQTFKIETLNANGTGTASLTCGAGCGWLFTIQVSPDRAMFNMAEIEVTHPNNYLAGTGVHQ